MSIQIADAFMVTELISAPTFNMNSTTQARFTNNLPRGGILDWCAPPEFRTTNAIPDLCSFHCFTKLKPKSFATGPFIALGMSPWLLGTESGGPHLSRKLSKYNIKQA